MDTAGQLERVEFKLAANPPPGGGRSGWGRLSSSGLVRFAGSTAPYGDVVELSPV